MHLQTVEHVLARFASDQIWPAIERRTSNYTALMPDPITYVENLCKIDDWQLYRLLGFPGCVTQYALATSATVAWNFSDVLLIVVSIGLIHHFKVFNEFLRGARLSVRTSYL
jgi:hypothetical protein